MTIRTNMKIAALSGLLALGGAAAFAQQNGDQNPFQQLDADGNGEITQAEFQAHAEARFAKVDADGDGFVTAEEMKAAGEARHAERAAKMLGRFDTDGNGSLDASELEAMGGKHGEMHGGKEGGKRGDKGGDKGARMIERMDANDDGKLSMEEMTQRHDPAKMFERLDKDENGSISAEEFEAAKKMHGKRHGKGQKMDHDKPQRD
jgi:Ca2+-binding EF-hand superfamily protein